MANQTRGNWGTRFGFILAATGSAIGLGNMWRFPYIAGANGGGAFVFIYFICICLIGIPVMLSEFVIGRSTAQNPIGAFKKLEGKRSFWILPGFLGVLGSFIILSYYSVVAGWVFDYTGKALTGSFSADQDPEQIRALLSDLLSDSRRQVLFQFIFISVTSFIVLCGVKSGIERASNTLMPLLLLVLFALLAYSFSQRGSREAWTFMFYPSFERLTPQGILEGLGHAFFTLSLGMGTMITYGSYLNRGQSLMRSTLMIAVLDTVVALVAGVIIFSIVFSFDLEPDMGPSLIFSTLPALFVQMPGGTLLAAAFFLLFAFAALTSAISIMEVIVAYFIDTFSWPRRSVTFGVGFANFLVGLLSALSHSSLSDFKLPVGFLFGEDLVFFDMFDKLASNILLPLGGFLIALYVGWKMRREVLNAEFTEREAAFLPALLFVLKYLAPALIAVVFLYGLAWTHPLFRVLGFIR